MTRPVSLFVMGLSLTVTTGCGGDNPAPPPPDAPNNHFVDCSTTVVRCVASEDGTDVTGDCLDSEVVDDFSPEPICVPLDPAERGESAPTLDEIEDPDALGQQRCEERVCDACLRRDECLECDTTFVAWGEECTPSAPFPGGGGSGGGSSDDPDGGVDDPGSLGAGYHILSFAMDGTSFFDPPGADRVTTLPSELVPPAAMAVPDGLPFGGLLWVLSEDGMLAGYDLRPDPPELLAGPFDLGVTGARTLEVYLRPGSSSDVWALVGAADGVHQFRVSLSEAVLTASVDMMDVQDVALNAHPIFRDDGHVSFLSGMGELLALTPFIGSREPGIEMLSAGAATSLTMEPFDTGGHIWLGIPGADLVEQWLFQVPFTSEDVQFTDLDRVSMGRQVIATGGAEFFPSTGGDVPAANFGIVVASNSASQGHLTYFTQGNLSLAQQTALEGEVLDMTAVRFPDEDDPMELADMLVFVGLARPDRVEIFFPHGNDIESEGDLPLDDEPLQVAVGLNQAMDDPDDPDGTDVSFLHVLILRE